MVDEQFIYYKIYVHYTVLQMACAPHAELVPVDIWRYTQCGRHMKGVEAIGMAPTSCEPPKPLNSTRHVCAYTLQQTPHTDEPTNS